MYFIAPASSLAMALLCFVVIDEDLPKTVFDRGAERGSRSKNAETPNALEIPAHLVFQRHCPTTTSRHTTTVLALDAPMMTFLQFAVLVLGHFALLAAGFSPQSVVDVASSSSSSSTALQAKRLPITMPTQTPMVPYRVSSNWMFWGRWAVSVGRLACVFSLLSVSG